MCNIYINRSFYYYYFINIIILLHHHKLINIKIQEYIVSYIGRIVLNSEFFSPFLLLSLFFFLFLLIIISSYFFFFSFSSPSCGIVCCVYRIFLIL